MLVLLFGDTSGTGTHNVSMLVNKNHVLIMSANKFKKMSAFPISC